jgi:hypothetical protein
MPRKKSKNEPATTRVEKIKTEMAKPRMSKSARRTERNLATRVPERASRTVPGIVKKVIPSPDLGYPEKAQIALGKAARQYRNLRIPNALNPRGDHVKFKKGAHVEVTVIAKPKITATICQW